MPIICEKSGWLDGKKVPTFRLRMREFIAWIHLIRLFCRVAASEADDVNALVTAALLNPLLLGMQANSQAAVRFRQRPGTPKPQTQIILSPLQARPNCSRRLESEDKQVIQSQSLRIAEGSDQRLQLKPIPRILRDRRKAFRTEQHEGKENSHSESIIEALKAEINKGNQEACLFLVSRPDMSSLSASDLLELLKLSKFKSRPFNASYEHFLEFYIRIVTIVVPRHHPDEMVKFLKFSMDESVPRRTFTRALKYAGLLSLEQLADFINYLELALIWSKHESLVMENFSKFAKILVQIALNISPDHKNLLRIRSRYTDLTKLESKVVESRNFGRSDALVKFIYELCSFAQLLSGTVEHGDEDILNIEKMVISAGSRLNLRIEALLNLFKTLIAAVQVEEYGFGNEILILKLMHDLHRLIMKNEGALAMIPSRMKGIEDLFLYIKEDCHSLVQARLLRYRNKRPTKSQILQLLNTANFADSSGSEGMLLILGFVRIQESQMDESDYAILNTRARMMLKLSNTIPESFEGEVCTANLESMHQTEIPWILPDDLFIPDRYNNLTYLYPYVSVLMDIPRLFLHRVFGIPLSFPIVSGSPNELPEMKELLDISNFFLERWCARSPEGPYSSVKIVGVK